MRSMPAGFGAALAALVAGAVASAAAAAAESAPPRIEEGHPFPTYVFPTLEAGDAKSIADFRGRRVLLINFASW